MGRGRMIAAVGAAITLIGCLPAWYTVGGEALPARSANAFDGAGIIVFIAAIAVLALIALPYAAGDQPVALDRPLSFLLLATLGVVGLVLRVIQLSQLPGALGLPDRSPGLWLAGVGLLVTGWGVAELLGETPRR